MLSHPPAVLFNSGYQPWRSESGETWQIGPQSGRPRKGHAHQLGMCIV